MSAGRLVFLIDHLIRLVDLLELLLDIDPRGIAALHLVKLYSQGLLVLRVGAAAAAGRGKHLVSDGPRR